MEDHIANSRRASAMYTILNGFANDLAAVLYDAEKDEPELGRAERSRTMSMEN